MDDCIFCAIAERRSPAALVHEDDEVLAFMDVQPVTSGHVLVVPRTHLPVLADLPSELGARLFTVAQELAAALRRSTLRCEGVNLFLADGDAASQEVPHAHLHVFPRFAGDGFGLTAEWRLREQAELEATAAQLREALR